jgi:DNA mismatch repair protein MSH3
VAREFGVWAARALISTRTYFSKFQFRSELLETHSVTDQLEESNMSFPKGSSQSAPQAQAKQRTISSFFGPKTTTSKSSTKLAMDTSLPAPESTQPKRPSSENIQSSHTKKRRVLSDDEDEDPITVVVPQRNRANQSNQSNKADRTSKYIFSSSAALEDRQEETVEVRKKKDVLHKKFVQKLGRPDSLAEIRRRNHVITEEDADAGADEDDQDDQEDEDQPKRKPVSTKGSGKLTPMEKQYLEIKRKHLDKVIAYQVGYKYRFWGEDARIAAKELSIVCIPGKFRFDEHPSEAHLDRFASASIPIARLHVHVKRLVTAGHKVGVVQQLETPALKKVGDNRNQPFKRELTNVYTQGTYVDEVDSPEGLDSSMSGYILCLTESNIRPGDDEKVKIGIVAVQPSIGSILYDEFEDGFMRGELETRLLHTSPCEYIIIGDLSPATHKLVKHLANSRRSAGSIKARIEYSNKSLPAEAISHISNFYADKIKNSTNTDESTQVLDKVHQLSEAVTLCLSSLIKHLTEFGLEHIFDLTTNFISFNTRTHMLLNGNTLSSLEIYESSADDSKKSSLFWTMDRTKTRFGRRLLRNWVGRPLLDKTQLEDRLEAVEEIKDDSGNAASLKYLLSLVKGDLEKTLIRIYYKRASRPEVLGFLQSFQKIASEQVTGFKSQLIKGTLNALPKVLDQILGYLERISLQAAKEDDKYAFFRDEYESKDITEQKFGIATVEHELEKHKAVAAKELGRKNVQYTTISGIEYLIEVENTKHTLSKVPASWTKISNTKKFSRFHTPTVVKLINERNQCKEKLANACDDAFSAFLGDISTNYDSLRDCIQGLAVLDCLSSLAEIASQPNYCKPEFTTTNNITITQGRHPMVEQILLDGYVPNDIALSANATEETPSALLITGPNMGGKSSYVRSIALIVIMAQIGSYVPASSATLPLMDAVFTRMGAFDNMMRSESTFMVELGETADILRQASSRSLVILDELGRGTSTHDGVAIAEAVLRELVSRKVMTLFITHYQDLARIKVPRLRNVHVKFEERGEDITFLYEIGEGMAHRSYG